MLCCCAVAHELANGVADDLDERSRGRPLFLMEGSCRGRGCGYGYGYGLAAWLWLRLLRLWRIYAALSDGCDGGRVNILAEFLHNMQCLRVVIPSFFSLLS